MAFFIPPYTFLELQNFIFLEKKILSTLGDSSNTSRWECVCTWIIERNNTLIRMHLHIGKAILYVFVAGCNMYTYEHLHMEKGKAILYPSPRFSAWPRSCGVLRRSESASCRARHGGQRGSERGGAVRCGRTSFHADPKAHEDWNAASWKRLWP